MMGPPKRKSHAKGRNKTVKLYGSKHGRSAMSVLLDRAIEAHGSLERWHGVRAIDVVFNFSGGLLDLKGFPGHHGPAVSVDTLKPRAVLQRLHGDPDDGWIFTADRVWTKRRNEEVVEECSEPRASFAGHGP
jgi:hypothetical protein